MYKHELVEAIAAKSGLPKSTVEVFHDALMEVIIQALEDGDMVNLAKVGALFTRKYTVEPGVTPFMGVDYPNNPGERRKIIFRPTDPLRLRIRDMASSVAT